MTTPMILGRVYELSQDEFVEQFGDIAEHSPWVAERAAAFRPFEDHAAMVSAFQKSILDADLNLQNSLILAHPDLAGRAALRGEVADDSKREQEGAGLDALTPDEFKRFHALNDHYRARFGFPFIFAVTGATKHQILEAFTNRMNGTEYEERLTALAQILRIVRFRLEIRVLTH